MKKGTDEPSSIRDDIGTALIILLMASSIPMLSNYEQKSTPIVDEPYYYYTVKKPKPIPIPVVQVRAEIPRELPRKIENIQDYTERRCNETFGVGHFSALNQIISHESGWRSNAQNPHSTAYGMFQFLNSTWQGTGIQKTSDPKQQVEAGLIYIKNRYQTPSIAWKFWQMKGWY